MTKSFLKFPMAFINGDEYRGLSTVAKLLYAYLADRHALSLKNGWKDENGRVFIFYTRKEASKALGVSDRRIGQYFCELAERGLIIEKRQGVGKANLIFVEDIMSADTRQNGSSATDETSAPDRTKCQPSNTEKNNTESEIIFSREEGGDKSALEDIFDKCEFEIFEDDTVALFKRIITGIYHSPKLAVGGKVLSQKELRRRLAALSGDALIYALDELGANAGDIKSPSAYLTAAIVNAADNYSAESLMDAACARHEGRAAQKPQTPRYPWF